MTTPLTTLAPQPCLRWTEGQVQHEALWRSESGAAVPKRVVVADDTMGADAAYRLACEGTALLWRGDFQNARQLLQAMARRAERKPKKARASDPQQVASTGRDAFNAHRQAQSQRARTLAMLVIPLDSDYGVSLRRAPDWRQACTEAYGACKVPLPDDATQGQSVVSLRELLGVVGAHEWRKKGVEIAALGDGPNNRIHPHYGVFSPVRGEYLALLAQAPLPPSGGADEGYTGQVFDIGTGTGVLSAVLARRGVQHIVATDLDARALACAQDNLDRLGCQAQVQVIAADLFPSTATHGLACLVVCNPPWLPARPSSRVEQAVYDPDSRMLRGFLDGLSAHLAPGGEGWLILSDLAEHLGLRSRDELLALIDAADLVVLGRLDIKPTHGKALDTSDALHAARAAEVTSLWRLGAAPLKLH